MKINLLITGAMGLAALGAVVTPTPTQRTASLTERLVEISREIQAQAPVPTVQTSQGPPAAIVFFFTNRWEYRAGTYAEYSTAVDFAECSSNAPVIKGGTGAADALATAWGAGLTNVIQNHVYGTLTLIGNRK